MADQFSRTRLLIGDDAIKKLSSSRVAVFGLGGVGSFVCEALSRTGVGTIVLVDFDKVDISNLNRQIIALHSTVGRYKTDVERERILDINPSCRVITHEIFFAKDTADIVDFSSLDFVVDAIDSVSGKIEIIMKSKEYGVNVISSMGTGNKLDPSRLRITDIFETGVCPLARVMRREMRKRGIEKLKVLSSDEPPVKIKNSDKSAPDTKKKVSPGSVSFVPSVAGLLIASEVVRELLNS